MKYLLIVTCLVFLSSQNAYARYTLNKDVRYFPIYETNPDNVIFEIYKKMSDECESKDPVFACMVSTTNTKYRTIPVRKGICAVHSFNLELLQLYLIPKWEGRSQHSVALQNKWIELLNNRTTNQLNHGEMLKQEMKKAHKKILGLNTSCSNIKSSVRRILNRATKDAAKEFKSLNRKEKYKITFPN